jgi:type I restriction enzyme S subunit
MSEKRNHSRHADWPYVSLGEVQVPGGIQGGPFGSQLHASDYVSAGIPLIMPKNIGHNRLSLSGHDFVNPNDAQRLSIHAVKVGDIVVGRKGDLSRRALIREAEEGWVCGTDCIRIRVDQSRISPTYLSYYMGLEFVSGWLHRHDSGSTLPSLNTSNLARLPVLLPPRRYQDAIATVLGALDDKIALNDRIAATARELAQSYFQAAVQADSHECDLASVTELVTRGVTPRYTEDATHLVVLNQRCVRDGRVSLDPARRTLADNVPAQKLLMPNDVLVNSTGFGTLGRVARWSHEIPCTVDSHITIVRFDEARIDPVCAGFAMLTAQKELESLGEGSTGQTELNRVRLSEFRITVPEEEKAKELRPTLQALETRGNAALAESVTLAKLRDTLLPGLMSGAIRVRDAERAVEEAT